MRRDILVSMIIVVLLLGVLEGVVRMTPLDDPEALGGSSLKYQQVVPPLFRPTTDGSGYRPRDPRLVDRYVPRAGKGGPTRIFVFGESAVAGLGMSENASFPRALERRLRAAAPGSTGAAPSVVNMGIVALSSRQVLAVERDVLSLLHAERASAGRVVFAFHVGNNEFLELHARRFLQVTGKMTFRLRLHDWLRQHLGLYRAVLALEARRRAHEKLGTRDFSTQDLRLSESELIQDLSVTGEEIDDIVSRHARNVRTMIDLARRSGITPVLLTVATNVEWTGLKDTLQGWLEEALGGPPSADPAARRTQLDTLLRRLTDESGQERGRSALARWKTLYLRASISLELGDAKTARELFIAAKDVDPHLRRCLSRMNENVRAIARETATPLVDGEEFLARRCANGIVGFEVLYDYVHFTPYGSELLAEAIEAELVRIKAVPGTPVPDWTERRTALLRAAARDSLDVREWLGWNGDKELLSDRSVWKYEKARAVLDRKVAEGTATPEEMAWAGNGYALEVGGERRARELYAAAKAHREDPAIESDLEWLNERPAVAD